ncbi:MAG: hypothetical protein LBI49_04070 [Nocardiopsaceae bacterium]|jgi:hypothetical protein|nr:hypothetical protein [Nocardiopsaceae bacterium]
MAGLDWLGHPPADNWPVASVLGLTGDSAETDLTPWQAVLALPRWHSGSTPRPVVRACAG